MKELKPVRKMRNPKMRIFYDFEPGDRLSVDEGITPKEFFDVLDKASHPVKKDKKTDRS